MSKKTTQTTKEDLLAGRRINPDPIGAGLSLVDLVDNTMLAYNGSRLREACRLFAGPMLEENATVGLSISGALTPAGLGVAAIIPLIKAGFVDWIVSTGANLFHDLHFGLGMSLRQGRPDMDDVELQKNGVVRIYDVLVDFDDLLKTDAFCRAVTRAEEFDGVMSSAEFHYKFGRYVREREKVLGHKEPVSLLSVAHEYEVPVYTSSPGDSAIGMNVASQALIATAPIIDVSADVNETAGIVLGAKKNGGRHGCLILGGGSPKNFLLQTAPQIQEVLGIEERGHDYFIQFTDARPDTGGLSGATPAEAVSWGKIDPDMLPDSVVAYVDTTVALPIMTAYAMARHAPRQPKRLYRQLGTLLEEIRKATRNFEDDRLDLAESLGE
ncbi:MAG: deoxyhypusine synthase [Deltaproteobacteria bacterium]